MGFLIILNSILTKLASNTDLTSHSWLAWADFPTHSDLTARDHESLVKIRTYYFLHTLIMMSLNGKFKQAGKCVKSLICCKPARSASNAF